MKNFDRNTGAHIIACGLLQAGVPNSDIATEAVRLSDEITSELERTQTQDNIPDITNDMELAHYFYHVGSADALTTKPDFKKVWAAYKRKKK